MSWSDSRSGLLGTRTLRPVLGVGWYSHELLYDGSYVLDSADLEWQGSRAWNGRESGLGAEFGLWFGMGLPGLGGSESDSRTDDDDPFDDPMEMDDLDEAEPSPSPPSSSNTAKNMELNLGLKEFTSQLHHSGGIGDSRRLGLCAADR